MRDSMPDDRPSTSPILPTVNPPTPAARLTDALPHPALTAYLMVTSRAARQLKKKQAPQPVRTAQD